MTPLLLVTRLLTIHIKLQEQVQIKKYLKTQDNTKFENRVLPPQNHESQLLTDDNLLLSVLRSLLETQESTGPETG